ncbi:cobalamin B12-binding domain protein [Desulfarculus baarsii DSM 2075]|uniref:Cobalamin B12-binding domain protein n=1 Tax=Desulfarculus baarsii (strain ATCC 33931 / DSM 2075 / LMG 7858 / VKM B-1802 / 2st14) TaxID=644282 RepID=E1QHH5_DESB2|nr:cobalamin-dependent protein [Desulfarculus baarsii]ADK85018.1 cobalamin B12-binding domain protein [Desulfarculus baarsii DSM 2075]
MADLKELVSAVVEMREDEAMALTKKLLADGTPPLAVFDAYQAALEEIGKRFEQQLYFIPELIMSGEMMKAASEIIKPLLADQSGGQGKQRLGKVVIATVEGDIHDIGKNIVAMMMDLGGLEVRDLGVDVPADRIIAEAKDFGADIIGLSGLLTLAFDPMKQVVEKLQAEGLRDKIKVIIGGGQMDEQVCKYVGADAFVTDAVAGVNYCKGWLA